MPLEKLYALFVVHELGNCALEIHFCLQDNKNELGVLVGELILGVVSCLGFEHRLVVYRLFSL